MAWRREDLRFGDREVSGDIGGYWFDLYGTYKGHGIIYAFGEYESLMEKKK